MDANTVERRAAVSDLVGGRSLTARSVLASALLGAEHPRLPVAALVAVASLFGISPGATRTCLWRMVSNGELVTDDDAGYALTGHLLERRNRVDDAARPHGVAMRWDGTWEIAVVSLERRKAAARLELRRAAAALHLSELREGVWVRPDNLDPERLPTSRDVLENQCVHFRRAQSDITADAVGSVFGLDDWVRDACRLIVAMNGEHESDGSSLAYRFALSVGVVRQLQRDPLLPAELLPEGWPADELRDTYRRFDRDFKRRLNHTFSLAGL
jgi:phenylacetic acid degradation operon negative regulatory protein